MANPDIFCLQIRTSIGQMNQNRNFVNYWTDVKGIIEQTLVFGSKLTTYDILEDLDIMGIKFITLRRRFKKLIEDANNIPENEWIKVDLKKENHKFNKFNMYEIKSCTSD